MSITFRVFVLFLAIYFSGCVTFNDITRPNIRTETEICADISMISLREESSNTFQEKELDSLSRSKILQVLSTYNIRTECETNKLKIQVKIHSKASLFYQAFLGVWSVFTVLSVGLIPTYSSFDVDLFVSENTDRLVAHSSYKHNTAIWLPFVFKQLRDDSYALENYNIDARASVLGTEIAKLIRSIADQQSQQKSGVK